MQRAESASQFDAAMRAAEDPAATPEERAEMLMEIAMGLQRKPRSVEQLRDAVTLYQRALAEAPEGAQLLKATIQARMGTALQAVPDGGSDALKQACDCYEAALPVLRQHGKPEAVAEAELNLGLATQALAGLGMRRLQDAIHCYHRALATFTKDAFPQEYAILHNNLAIAYLSIPASDQRAKMREALAVQSFEEVLRVVNLVDHPSEYAMIQNNLGNALQYAPSGHPLENNLRALAAYDEALKVRNPRDTPVEYANTIANKANVLRNLPAGTAATGAVGDALDQALALFAEAMTLFRQRGLPDRAELMAAAVDETRADLARRNAANDGTGAGAAH